MIGAGGTGSFIWYRRKYLKFTWREVFFLGKSDEDKDGSDIQIEIGNKNDDDDYHDGSERNKKLLSRHKQTINLDDEEDAGIPVGSEVDNGFTSTITAKKKQNPKVPPLKGIGLNRKNSKVQPMSLAVEDSPQNSERSSTF